MSTKIAVVGCGYWGKNLVRNFNELSALELVCDVTANVQSVVDDLAPNCKLVNSFSQVLASDVDGVVIATPAVTHYDLVKVALEAGKDVFVEKPLAMTYEQGAHLVELAENHKRILMVGHVLEYHPAVAKLIKLIRQDELGTVNYIYSNRLSLGKVRREENILWSFAPHDIAIILRIMGTLPFQVVACGGSYVQPNIADVTVTNLLFNNGVRAHIYVSWLHPFKEQRLVVIGSRRMASFDDVSKQLQVFDQRVEVKEREPIPIRGVGEQISYDNREPLRLECEAFLDAIVTRTPPLTDGRSGLNVLKVLQAAQRSLILNGQQETLAVETFIESRASVPFNGNIKVVDENGHANGDGHGKKSVKIINA